MEETRYKLYFEDQEPPKRWHFELSTVMEQIYSIRAGDNNVADKIAFILEYQRRFDIDFSHGYPDFTYYDSDNPFVLGAVTPEGHMIHAGEELDALFAKMRES